MSEVLGKKQSARKVKIPGRIYLILTAERKERGSLFCKISQRLSTLKGILNYASLMIAVCTTRFNIQKF